MFSFARLLLEATLWVRLLGAARALEDTNVTVGSLDLGAKPRWQSAFQDSIASTKSRINGARIPAQKNGMTSHPYDLNMTVADVPSEGDPSQVSTVAVFNVGAKGPSDDGSSYKVCILAIAVADGWFHEQPQYAPGDCVGPLNRQCYDDLLGFRGLHSNCSQAEVPGSCNFTSYSFQAKELNSSLINNQDGLCSMEGPLHSADDEITRNETLHAIFPIAMIWSTDTGSMHDLRCMRAVEPAHTSTTTVNLPTLPASTTSSSSAAAAAEITKGPQWIAGPIVGGAIGLALGFI